jgi:hypothetical protein
MIDGLQNSFLFWLYLSCIAVVCLIKWPKNPGTWSAAMLVVLTIAVTISNPNSSRPAGALVYDNGVWLRKDALLKIQALSFEMSRGGLAYSENDFTEGCQQKTGKQLLSFPRIKTIQTYLETRGCTFPAADLPKQFSVDGIPHHKDCQKLVADVFENPDLATYCISTLPKSSNVKTRWSILLNCSQSSREYQLRWRIPNLLTGGDALQSFAGINFRNGICLDVLNKKEVGLLLDVIGVGYGLAQYTNTPQ